VKAAARRGRQTAHLVFGAPAQQVEPALEKIRPRSRGRRHIEHLDDGQHLAGQVARRQGVDGHRPPADQGESLAVGGLRDEGFDPGSVRRLLGQENQTGRIHLLGRQRQPRPVSRLPQEGIGLLNENAGPVAGGFVAAAGAPVGQVNQDLQGVLDEAVAFGVVDLADHPHTAGVVLALGAVESSISGALVAGHSVFLLSSMGGIPPEGAAAGPFRRWLRDLSGKRGTMPASL
jgi:hypothetical protein